MVVVLDVVAGLAVVLEVLLEELASVVVVRTLVVGRTTALGEEVVDVLKLSRAALVLVVVESVAALRSTARPSRCPSLSTSCRLW